MRALVIVLEGATSELLLEDERLVNVRRLMEWGSYGVLDGTFSSDIVPVWLSMATGREPAEALAVPTIWDELGQVGKRSILVGLPPAYPPRPLNGVAVGSNLTPWPPDVDRAFPPELAEEIEGMVGPCEVALHLLERQAWDYFQVVDSRLAGVQRAALEPRLVAAGTGTARPEIAPGSGDGGVQLDEELGALLELLDENTAVLVLALPDAGQPAGGAQRRGAFVLAAPTLPPQGEMADVSLLDIMPTLLDLVGVETWTERPGRSLVRGVAGLSATGAYSEEDEEIIRQRLVGLGYIE
jgi:predicted AlkP superfamily phosphohydrolase/phosphomutase